MTIILAGVIALSTMHVLTLPAVTLTEDTAGEDPGIVLDGENGTDPAEPSEDPVVIEVTPEPEPTPEETYIPEPTAEPSFEPAPEPTPEVTPVPAETPVTTEEPTAVPTEEPTPETTVTPEPTVTPEMTPVPSETPEVTAEPTETPEATPEPSEEPEETAEPTAEPVPDMTEEEEEELAENQLVSEEDLKNAEPAADPEADRESAEYWMSMFSGIELSGVWADDLITIAESQIGYHESTRNFVVANKRHYGYSRYGAWYGSPYGDWCAMFVSYCLNYAGIPRESVPYEAYCPRWIELLAEQEMYVSAGEYVPAKGDLIFFDWNRDATADHVGLVKAVEYEEENPAKIITIEGNSSDAVHQNTYAFDDNRIMGFGILPENPDWAPNGIFTGTADNIEVTVVYDGYTFPSGTTMHVQPVYSDDVLAAISSTVTDKNIVQVQAVDITFRNADGVEIEPARPINVTMQSRTAPVEATEAPVVVHVDDELSTTVVDTQVLSGSTWSHTWNIGGTESSHDGFDYPAMDANGRNYLYYVVELDAQGNAIEVGGSPLEGYVLQGYSANNNTGVSNQGVITVYNRAEGAETINVVIKKTDNAENSTNYLDGAVFKLMYRSDSSGTYTNVSSESVPQLNSESKFTVPTDGITLTGLVDGQYQLQEISPPSGYVITNSTPVTFTVSGGAITSMAGTITGVRYTAASETSDAEFIIPNEPGAALPSTGGPGTRLFTLLGSILILGAGALLCRRRRFI